MFREQSVGLSDRCMVPLPKLRKSVRSAARVRHSWLSSAHWLAKRRANGSETNRETNHENQVAKSVGRAALDCTGAQALLFRAGRRTLSFYPLGCLPTR